MKKLAINNRLVIYSIIFFLLYVGVTVFSYVSAVQSPEKESSPIGIDYWMLYTAGDTALTGNAEDIFDVKSQQAIIEENLGAEMPKDIQWFYPPTFLLMLVSLLSIFPYPISLALWLILTLSLAIASACLIVPMKRNLSLLMIAFPGVLYNMRWGQNSFLSTALVCAGIGMIKTNPVLSGLMFGLLTFKPQLAVFPFLVLLVTREWKVLKWSIIFGGMTVIISLLIYGPKVWHAFLHHFFVVSPTLLTSIWEKTTAIQPTMNTALKLLGVDGRVLNVILILLCILVTWFTKRIWDNTDRMTLRGSAMVLGIFIFIPYFIQYDLMLLSIPFILLVYDLIIEGYKRVDIIMVGLLWLMPLVNLSVVQLTGVQISPFVAIGLFVYVYHRAKTNIFSYPSLA
jgi:hypothetical protein